MAAPAATVGGIGAAKAASDSAYGLIQGFLHAMEKPIYSDLRVDVTTHTTPQGYVCTSTHTKGWTVPLGLIVGGLGVVAVWEIGMEVAGAFGGVGGGLDGFMNPLNWAETVVKDIFGVPKKDINGDQITKKAPPSGMAAASNLVNQLLIPGGIFAQKFGNLISSGVTP